MPLPPFNISYFFTLDPPARLPLLYLGKTMDALRWCLVFSIRPLLEVFGRSPLFVPSWSTSISAENQLAYRCVITWKEAILSVCLL